jgi:phytoene/squalene synthetase
MVAKVVRELLRQANERYRQGLSGLRFLPWRAAIAIGVAAAVYADIGTSLARQGYDPLRGRAFTSTGRKVWLALGVVAGQLAVLPQRWLGGPTGTQLGASKPATPAELLLS